MISFEKQKFYFWVGEGRDWAGFGLERTIWFVYYSSCHVFSGKSPTFYIHLICLMNFTMDWLINILFLITQFNLRTSMKLLRLFLRYLPCSRVEYNFFFNFSDDHARGLTTFTLLAGSGGFIGYLLGAVDWKHIQIFGK